MLSVIIVSVIMMNVIALPTLGHVLRMSPTMFPARLSVSSLVKLFVFVTDTLRPEL